MKLRQTPTDFCVHEINSIEIVRRGSYSVYQLTKTSWNTLDVLQRIAQAWKISAKKFEHAGLKDRHAVTTQLITISNGPQKSFVEENIRFEYLGQADRATSAQDIVANQFSIVLRDLADSEVHSAEQALPEIAGTGIANYFDDQRFGSYIAGKPFIAEHWMRREYEQALWLAFAEPHPFDDAVECEQKRILREHWEDWATCKQQLERSHRRSIVTFLDDRPGDFKGAWSKVNADLRGMYLTAFQSHLWNQILSQLIAESCPREELIEYQLKPGAVLIPKRLSEERKESLFQTHIPLPSARVKLLDEDIAELVNGVLNELGWPLKEIKVHFPRDRFFPRAIRKAFIPVSEVTWNFADDELSLNRKKLEVQFRLPSGSYATMVVKRLLLQANQ